MKQLILKELHVENFQKFQQETFEFGEVETLITGENRAGKTTVQSAMLWLLFGKDAYGQTDTGRGAFDIKRRENGQTVPHTDVLVEGIFLLNGEPIRLKRVLHENWTKKGEYTGDETQCFINDVPAQVGEYQTYISGIIEEDEFRMITNISNFLSLPTAYKRNYLCAMGGVQSLEDIVNTSDNDTWKQFLRDISGKTIEDALKQIAYERKELKKQYDKIDPSIQSLQKVKPESKDWEALEAEREGLQSLLMDVNESLSDVNKASQAQQEEINLLRKQVSDKRKEFHELTARLIELKQKALSDAKQVLYNKDEDRRNKQNQMQTLSSRHKELALSIDTLTIKKEQRNKEMEQLMQKYDEEQERVFTATSQETICPLLAGHVCNSPQLQAYMQENRQKAEADFNVAKQERLADILKEGRSKKAERDNAEQELASASEEISAIARRMEALQTVIDSLPIYSNGVVDESTLIIPNKAELESQRIQVNADIANLEEHLKQKETSDKPSNPELVARRAELNKRIEEIIRELSVKDQIEKIETEIDRLGKEGKQLAAQITELENRETTAREINRTIMEDATERVNKLFSMVQWQMFEQQKNGLYAEVCKPTINGVCNSLNYEARINIGIDICNAIARFKGFTAPLFIDNAESVNDTLPYIGQTIRCMVAPKGNKLNIQIIK